MGPDDLISVDEAVENTTVIAESRVRTFSGILGSSKSDLIVVFIAAAIFLGCTFSPPHLMDDVDSVQAQIARNMLESGDWVTAGLDGVAYLEKSPLNYWMIAASFGVFGVHDWAGGLPRVSMVVVLCWVLLRFGTRGLGRTDAC